MDWVGISGLAALWATLVTSHALLRREFKADNARLEAKIDRLDDRVYQLATGLKPLVEQSQKSEAS